MSIRTCCLGALLLVVSAACTSGPPPPDETVQVKDIDAHRAAVDRFMRENKDSPIPPERRGSLLPLQYFPVDPGYSVPAELKVSEDRPVSPMPTSTGTIARYQRVGVLEFTFHGQNLSLGAFVPEGQPIDQLFVPFTDTTSGSETYAAGRYLDLRPTATNLYTIDFNYAYNPYCAYNKSYECPYPPPSNRLKVAIRAGEKAPPE
ncbi:MAG TPA: DUF1684 domain-containing protein [Vicinamibacterales bacterium]|nr:DUF1684 domain-containing protein [Vicinamibacterales bacterium]